MIGIDPADPARSAALPDGAASTSPPSSTVRRPGRRAARRHAPLLRRPAGARSADGGFARRAARCRRRAGRPGRHRHGAASSAHRSSRCSSTSSRTASTATSPVAARPATKYRTLADLIEFNSANAATGDAVVRAGDVRAGGEEGTAERAGVPARACRLPAARPGRRASMRRCGAIDSTPSSVPPADRPGRRTW